MPAWTFQYSDVVGRGTGPRGGLRDGGRDPKPACAAKNSARPDAGRWCMRPLEMTMLPAPSSIATAGSNASPRMNRHIRRARATARVTSEAANVRLCRRPSMRNLMPVDLDAESGRCPRGARSARSRHMSRLTPVPGGLSWSARTTFSDTRRESSAVTRLMAGARRIGAGGSGLSSLPCRSRPCCTTGGCRSCSGR